MKDRYLNIIDGLIEKELYDDFLKSLLKQLTPARIELLFKKIIYGELRAENIFNIEEIKRDNEELDKQNNKLFNKVDKLEKLVYEKDEEISSLTNAIRHYEDYLMGYKYRTDIINSRGFGKLLEEEESWMA